MHFIEWIEGYKVFVFQVTKKALIKAFFVFAVLGL